MNTFATGSLPVHFSVAKLFNFRWQYTRWSDDETFLWEVLDVSCHKKRPVFGQRDFIEHDILRIRE